MTEPIRTFAYVIAKWRELVGPQLATVTVPRLLTGDGTLVIDVATAMWLDELRKLEVEVIASLPLELDGIALSRIRWRPANWGAKHELRRRRR